VKVVQLLFEDRVIACIPTYNLLSLLDLFEKRANDISIIDKVLPHLSK
jgi:hypothetical protein